MNDLFWDGKERPKTLLYSGTERREEITITTTTALNSAKNIIDQQAIKLEEQHKKLHKYSTELKSNTIKNQSKLILKVALIVGAIHLAAVLSVGYLIMQKQPMQPQINLDSKAVSKSIVEQLRSKK